MVSVLAKAFGIWVGFVAIAIANGTFRNAIVSPRLGDYAGHVISSILLSAIVFLLTLFVVPCFHVSTGKAFLGIGVFWMCLTICFEFPFGHYVAKAPWSKLLADYNILKGRLWLLVLVTTLLSPLIAGKIRGII